MKKSLGIDIMFPWEIGLIIIILGIVLVYMGDKQGKKLLILMFTITRSTTKLVVAHFNCFGLCSSFLYVN